MSISSKLLGSISIFSGEKITIHRERTGILKAKIEGEKDDYLIKPIRCFPFTDTNHYIELYAIEPDGTIKKEIAIISDINKIKENYRQLLEEELNKAFFPSEITKIYSVKLINKQVLFDVEINKNRCLIKIRHLANIHIIKPSFVILKDIDNNRFCVNPTTLDIKSRRWLEMFI